MQEDRVIRTEENIRTDGQTRRMAVIKLRVIDLGYPSLRVRSPDGRGDGSFAISCIPSFISVIVRSSSPPFSVAPHACQVFLSLPSSSFSVSSSSHYIT